MPNNETRSQVSIHIDLTEGVNGDDNETCTENGATDMEMHKEAPSVCIAFREVGKWDHVQVATHSPMLGDSFSRQKVSSGKNNCPIVLFLACVFTPVVFISALTYLPFYVLIRSFPEKKDATSSETYTVESAEHTGWSLTIGLVSAWGFIICICCLCATRKHKYLDYTNTEIPKEIYEKPYDPNLEVVDWGGIEGPLKQLMHASVYSYCVKEDEKPKYTRTVRFTVVQRSPFTRALYVLAAIFYVGFIVLLVMSFWRQRDVSNLLTMWICLSTFTIIPSLSFAAGLFYKSDVLQIDADVAASKQGQGVSKVQHLRFTTSYYPRELTGKLLSSYVYET
jgi:hypothetical protein